MFLFSADLWRKHLCQLLPAMCAFVLALEFATAQTSSQQRNAQQTAKTPSQFAEAQELIAQGQLDEAKEKIQKQLKENPTSVEGFNLLGIVCSSQKDYPGALNAFEHALKIEPKSTKTRNNLANFYVAEQRPDLAEKEFRNILTLVPANRDANYNLGLLLVAKGAPAAALPYLERVRPQDVETRFNLVRAYLQVGRTAEGLKTATALSTEKKEDVQLHFTLGVLLASEKQYNTAQLELEKANALQPETFEILYNLGQVYLRSSEYAKAELALNRALKLKPDSRNSLPDGAGLFRPGATG